METNEIKKFLYKEKPLARRVENAGDDKRYTYHVLLNHEDIFFDVPISDMGEKIFDEEIPAQLLIRWLTSN